MCVGVHRRVQMCVGVYRCAVEAPGQLPPSPSRPGSLSPPGQDLCLSSGSLRAPQPPGGSDRAGWGARQGVACATEETCIYDVSTVLNNGWGVLGQVWRTALC